MQIQKATALALLFLTAPITRPEVTGSDQLTTILLSSPSTGIGPPQGVYTGVGDSAAMNSLGHVVFTGVIQDSEGFPSEVSVWKYFAGILEPLISNGVPEEVDGQVFTFHDLNDQEFLTLNDLGDVAYTGRPVIDGGGPYQGLWIFRNDKITSPVREKIELSGFGSEWFVAGMYASRFNSNSTAAFYATMFNPVSQAFRQGVWFTNNGHQPELIQIRKPPALLVRTQ